MLIKSKYRIGIIASSGGSVFIELHAVLVKYLPGVVDFIVVTDRKCGIEDFCENSNVKVMRIEEVSNQEFSSKACKYLESFGQVDCLFLFYMRLITADLYSRFVTINFHPSLLPAYTGFNAIKRFIRDNGKFFGATAHVANECVDGGLIVAQVVHSVNATDLNEAYLNKLSFLQKVYLSLSVTELILLGFISIDSKNGQVIVKKIGTSETSKYNPAISFPDFIRGYHELLAKENLSNLV